jgi:hypothetical protein
MTGLLQLKYAHFFESHVNNGLLIFTQCVRELILVNNRLLIKKTVRFINRRQLSTAPVDGAVWRCSTILQCKGRTDDGKKRKVA